MDFRQLLNGSTLYNLHSHTQFCDGRDTMDAFARAAVAAGFTHYGFSPHSPTPFPTPCNMRRDDVPAYLAEVDRIRAAYGPTVFLASMEIDYLGPEWGPDSPYFRSLPLDYRIGSVHFIPDQDGNYVDIDGSPESFIRKMHSNFRDDIRYVVETFYEHSIAMVRAGGLDIIGHLDKIGHNASHFAPGIEAEPWYTALAHELIRAVAEAGITAEINTKAYERCGRMFPSQALLPLVRELGIPLVVNSDAHYPDRINSGRPEGLALIS